MKRSLVHNAAYNFIYQLLNVLFPLLSASYLSRVLLPAGMGKMDYAQNILSYFVMVAGLGLSAYGTREIAKCHGDRQKTDAVFSELLILCAAATALCAAAYVCLCRLLFPEDLTFYLIVGTELVFGCLGLDWFCQGTEEYGYIALRNAVVKIVSFAALLLFVKDRDDCLRYAVIHSLSVGCGSCCNVVYAFRRVKLTAVRRSVKRHLRPLLHLTGGAVAAGLYTRLGVTVLGRICGVEAVAYYTNADKVCGMALCLVTAATAVFLPRLSYLYDNERERFHQCLTDGLKIALLLAVPAAVGMALVAENLVGSLFGAAFLPAAQTLRIFAVLTVVKGAGDLLCYQAVISSGREKELLPPRVAAGVVSLMLSALLIPRYGHNASALALVAGELTVNGWLLRRTLSVAKVRLRAGFCISVAVSAAVMAAVVSGIQRWMEPGVLSLAAAVLGGVISYAAMLFVTRNEMIRRRTERGEPLWEEIAATERKEDIWKR